MNNSFKVLWFEDEPTWLKMGQKKLSNLLNKNHSLIANIEAIRSSQTFDVDILKSNQYDLILMDFNLVDGYVGTEIIKLIRQNNILTDILFYSSEEKKMIDSVKSSVPEIDGIYLTKRDNTVFFKKTENLISKIVRRSEDIVNLRGMVLDATSNFEEITKDFLNKLWDYETSENRKEIEDILKEKVISSNIKRINNTCEQFNSGKEDFKSINNIPGFLSMNDRLTVIENYSEQKSKTLIIQDEKINDYYKNRLGVFRNALGHKKAGDKITVFGKEYCINDQFHKMLRQNINELEIVFEPTLNSLLSE